MKLHDQRRNRGFLLFEAMIAVTIFTMAVLMLGKCMDNCLRAEVMLQDEDRARRALENRMAEIEAGSVKVDEKGASDELRDFFAGMTLQQRSEPMTLKNENDEEVTGINLVTLDLAWSSRGEKRTRTLQFYVLPRSR